MSTSFPDFTVTITWSGSVDDGESWFPIIGHRTVLAKKKFAESVYIFNLAVTETSVKLAGAGTDASQNYGLNVLTDEYLGLLTGKHGIVYKYDFQTFTPKAEGWLEPPDAECDQVPGPFVAELDPDSGSFIDKQRMLDATGIVVGFKGSVDSTPLTVATAAPTLTLAIPSGPSIAVPVGPTVTTSTGGIHYSGVGKFKLCPDGYGGYKVTVLSETPKPSVVGKVGITLDWYP